jgi:threonine/homoserine/homoserine lactone efflux protein
MRNALAAAGPPACARRSAGASGRTLHAAAAALGVSALLATSAAAYATLKIVGIAYLLYLGVRMLLSARRPSEPEREARGGRPFAQGFVSNALNPKVALFFLTFLPQFLPDGGAALPTAIGLSAIFTAIYLAWFTGLIAVVERIASALRSPRASRWVGRVTGGTLVAFAVRLAAQGRH